MTGTSLEGRVMRACSMDLRVRVLADRDGGLGTAAVAARYRVSASWVGRLKQRRRASGETAPRPPGGRPPTGAADAYRIRAAVRAAPGATLAELKAAPRLAISPATLWWACAALGPSMNKKSGGRPSRTGRT